MRVKITLLNNGGEFAMGVVTRKKEKALLLAMAESEELDISNYNEDGDIQVDFFEQTQILSAYGPDARGMSIAIEIVDEDNNVIEEIYSTIDSSIEYEEITFQTIMESNPYIESDDLLDEYKEDDLIFGGYSLEKNILQSYYIDTENFDPKFIVIATKNLDETLGDFEIVSSLFYINDEALLSLVKLYSQKEEIKLTEAREMLQDIFDELSPNPKIFEQFEIKFEEQEPGDGYETCAKLLDIYGDEIYSTEQ